MRLEYKKIMSCIAITALLMSNSVVSVMALEQSDAVLESEVSQDVQDLQAGNEEALPGWQMEPPIEAEQETVEGAAESAPSKHENIDGSDTETALPSVEETVAKEEAAGLEIEQSAATYPEAPTAWFAFDAAAPPKWSTPLDEALIPELWSLMKRTDEQGIPYWTLVSAINANELPVWSTLPVNGLIVPPPWVLAECQENGIRYWTLQDPSMQVTRASFAPSASISLQDGQILHLKEADSSYTVTSANGLIETHFFNEATIINASGSVKLSTDGAATIGPIKGSAAITLMNGANLTISTTERIGLAANSLTVNGAALNVTASASGIKLQSTLLINGGNVTGISKESESGGSGVNADAIMVNSGQLQGTGIYGIYSQLHDVKDGAFVQGTGSKGSGIYVGKKMIVEGASTEVNGTSAKGHGINVSGYLEVNESTLHGISVEIPKNVYAGIYAYELKATNATIVGQGMSHGVYVVGVTSSTLANPGVFALTNSTVTGEGKTGTGIYGKIRAVNSCITSHGGAGGIRSSGDVLFSDQTIVETTSSTPIVEVIDDYHYSGLVVYGKLRVENSTLTAKTEVNGAGLEAADTVSFVNSDVTLEGGREGLDIGDGIDVPNETLYLDHANLKIVSKKDGMKANGNLLMENESTLDILSKNWGLEVRGSTQVEDSRITIQAEKYGILYWLDDRNPTPVHHFINSDVTVTMLTPLYNVGVYNYGTQNLPTGSISISGGTFKVQNDDFDSNGVHSMWSGVFIEMDAKVEVSASEVPMYVKDIAIDHASLAVRLVGEENGHGGVYGAPDTVELPALYALGEIWISHGGSLVEQYVVPVSKKLTAESSMPYASGMNIAHVKNYDWRVETPGEAAHGVESLIQLEASDNGVRVINGSGTAQSLIAIRTAPIPGEAINLQDTSTHTIFMTADFEGPASMEYEVQFDTNGAGAIASQTVTEGTKMTEPERPTKEGYLFDGWYVDNGTFNQKWDFAVDTVSSNMTLYAKWTEAAKPVYTVAFDTDGGGSISSQQVIEGGKVTMPTDPVKSGYTFAGWYTDGGTFKQKWDFEKDIVATPMTLYAKWIAATTEGGNNGGGGGGYYPWPYPESDNKLEEPQLETEHHIVYVKGYPNGSFQPNGHLTRAEAAMIFYRLLTDQHQGGSMSLFSDVKSGVWYTDAINKLASMGILKGYDDGSFKPNQTLTRAELAAITARFFELNTASSKGFTDVPASHWASAYIASNTSNGWIDGYPDGTFKPSKAITRAESVKMINRMLDRRMDESKLEQYRNAYTDISRHWALNDILEASITHDYTHDDTGMEMWNQE
ncbi:InlB B-repeat-containing protein [Paenibacillus sp. 1001270B_150601_E10]|uniref:InlB B-repeat-containing protein n=1 Tax=Paenibacillus sp. 1001270B_150601_E10 TaxID=2787079 RepID=UPI001E4065B8|nr:InlB B-repeat-containing protein [Paenibacillus sp. 1001270B_150601_E10]